MTPNYLTTDQLAEQAGHRIAHTAMEGMKQAPSQTERLDILSSALLDVLIDTSKGRHAVLVGFSVGVLNILERGLGVHP